MGNGGFGIVLAEAWLGAVGRFNPLAKKFQNASIVEKEVIMQKNAGIRRKMLMMKHN